MPLIVGIVNGPEKGFTSREISLINGFGFGILATQAGVGHIGDRYGVKMTPAEFRRRMLLVNQANEIFNMGDFYDIMTLEFCERLAEADWSCNTSTWDKRKFNTEFKNWLVRLQEGRMRDFERQHVKSREEE
tara:strand:- start:412 stop:807 length:396 start_codon:yes stop_codon:yes gene_type:complete